MTSDDPLKDLSEELRSDRERYVKEVQNSRHFQDAQKYLESMTMHMLMAQSFVQLQGSRFSAGNDYLLFRFASHLNEAALAVMVCAKEGMQNAARRELRFLLEAAVKLSSRDTHADAKTFEERLSGLGDGTKRFEDYVAELQYFVDFANPEEANAEILSLYKDLSRYVHASVPQFQNSMARMERGEPPGRESVATLNKFNKLAFRVYDLVLVRIFYGVGPSLAGDIFTGILDDEPKWCFHKGKFTGRMSRCFDYKHERRVRRGEI